MHECPRCLYFSKNKSDVQRHFDKNNKCQTKYSNISIEECKLLLNQNKFKIQKIFINHVCEYCNKVFDRKKRLDNHNLKCKKMKNINTGKKEQKIKDLEEQLKQSQLLLSIKEEEKLKQSQLLLIKKEKEVHEFVYIIQTREFINSGEDIFKLGKTINPKNRMGNYPKGSQVMDITKVNDCDKCEKELLKIFEGKFIKMSNLGNEYFKGDINFMTKEIRDYLFSFNLN